MDEHLDGDLRDAVDREQLELLQVIGTPIPAGSER
jgi:hypothetical protein